MGLDFYFVSGFRCQTIGAVKPFFASLESFILGIRSDRLLFIQAFKTPGTAFVPKLKIHLGACTKVGLTSKILKLI